MRGSRARRRSFIARMARPPKFFAASRPRRAQARHRRRTGIARPRARPGLRALSTAARYHDPWRPLRRRRRMAFHAGPAASSLIGPLFRSISATFPIGGNRFACDSGLQGISAGSDRFRFSDPPVPQLHRSETATLQPQINLPLADSLRTCFLQLPWSPAALPLPVRVRNLSAYGALLDGESLPLRRRSRVRLLRGDSARTGTSRGPAQGHAGFRFAARSMSAHGSSGSAIRASSGSTRPSPRCATPSACRIPEPPAIARRDQAELDAICERLAGSRPMTDRIWRGAGQARCTRPRSAAIPGQCEANRGTSLDCRCCLGCTA